MSLKVEEKLPMLEKLYQVSFARHIFVELFCVLEFICISCLLVAIEWVFV